MAVHNSEYEREPFYAPERILVIAAHADDIEFGAGGTVARWTDMGCRVAYCLVTDGGAGSGDPTMTRARLAEIRRAEQIEAAKVLGVAEADVYFLGYPDGQLVPTLDVRRDIARVIRIVRPELVVTMDPTVVFVPEFNYINHPDHRATGEAALYGLFPSASVRLIFPELLDEGLEPHKPRRLYLMLATEPNLYIDVTRTFERKIEALRCHESQFGGSPDDFVKWVREGDAAVGAQVGAGYAESFRVMSLE